MPNDPLAYHITWTCRGTWLPGDQRGWVDRDHNLYGHPRLAPNPYLEAALRGNLRDNLLILNDAARAAVEEAIREHCDHKD
jgi:hypothetical protein